VHLAYKKDALAISKAVIVYSGKHWPTQEKPVHCTLLLASSVVMYT